MSGNTKEYALRLFVGMMRMMLSTGRPVAAEDAARAVKTPDGFDRRAFGPMVAWMKRNGEIEEAGFRESKTAKHHRGVKRLWVTPKAQTKRGTAE